MPRHCKQRHDRELAQQHRRRPLDRQVRPLPLRLQPQVRTRLLEGHFHTPELDHGRQDLNRPELFLGTDQHRQGPDPWAEGHRHLDHQGDPPLAEALDDVLPRRPHGLEVATLGPVPAAMAVFDRVVVGQGDQPVAGDEGDDRAGED
jgi:hypothetical protein